MAQVVSRLGAADRAEAGVGVTVWGSFLVLRCLGHTKWRALGCQAPDPFSALARQIDALGRAELARETVEGDDRRDGYGGDSRAESGLISREVGRWVGGSVMNVTRRWIHAVKSLLLLAVLCGGCASTKMHSFVDPDFQGHRYERLLVAVQLEHLDQRDDAEREFVKRLGKHGVICLRALDVLPPTRKYDEEQFQKALSDTGVDGILIVRETDYYEDEYYVPPSSSTYTTGNLSSNTYYHGNRSSTIGTAHSTSHTTTSGGYTYTKPRVRHEGQLWDVQTGRMAWIAGAFTRGNARARFRHLTSSVAEEMAETLCEEGLIGDGLVD